MRIFPPVVAFADVWSRASVQQDFYWHNDRLAITYEIIYKARNHAVLAW
jgi:hypothetical protein